MSGRVEGDARPCRMVALLARQPGWLVLRNALAGFPGIELAAVMTHGRLPRAEGGGERADDLARFQELTDTLGVPLLALDGLAARNLADHLPAGPLDLLVSLSWRYLVSDAVLSRFTMGGINLHRGALPAYGGALPVQRAIEAGERRVAITAHDMTAEIDGGQTIAEVWLDIAPLGSGVTPAAYAEEVKQALEPLYAPLARLAVTARLGGTELR